MTPRSAPGRGTPHSLTHRHSPAPRHRPQLENTLLVPGTVPQLKICDFGFSKAQDIQSETSTMVRPQPPPAVPLHPRLPAAFAPPVAKSFPYDPEPIAGGHRVLHGAGARTGAARRNVHGKGVQRQGAGNKSKSRVFPHQTSGAALPLLRPQGAV